MRLENKKVRVSILLSAILVLSFLGFYFNTRTGGLETSGVKDLSETFSFGRPAFAQSMAATTTFLEQEAGISIYVNTSSSLNLNTAKNTMIIVENVTSDYVIGSLSWTGLSSNDYPHAFVHKDGWIVVYYLKVNPSNPGTTGWIGKIIDWQYYVNKQLTNNLLLKGLQTISAALGVSTADAKYYHFQYPDATKLMIAIKGFAAYGPAQTFNIKVPDTLTIYERSWSLYSESDTWGAHLKIDDTVIHEAARRSYGGPEITEIVLSPNVFHTVTVWADYTNGYACLLILYK